MGGDSQPPEALQSLYSQPVELLGCCSAGKRQNKKPQNVPKNGVRTVFPSQELLKDTEPRPVIISPRPSCHHRCPSHARKDILRNSLERLLCLFFRPISAAGRGTCSAVQEADGERKIKLIHIAPVKLPKIAFLYIKPVMKPLIFLGALHNKKHIP